MDPKKNRIAARREAKGWSQTELADRVRPPTSKMQIYQLESGRRGLTYEWMIRLSEALGCDPQDLITDAGNAIDVIPVVGYVGAGAEVNPIDDHEKGGGIEEIEVPSGLNLRGYVAARIIGDSMYPRYFDGEIIVFKRDCDWLDEFYKQECVVMLEDGRAFVKTIERGSSNGLFTLISFNAPPILDVRIKWACPVYSRLKG